MEPRPDARTVAQFQPRMTADEAVLRGLPDTFEGAVERLHPWMATQRAFLEAVRNGATFRMASEAAHVHRETYKHWRSTSPVFEVALRLALEERAELLVAEAKRRAVEGVVRRKPIMYKGEVVDWYEETEYSDKLLIYLLETEVAGVDPTYRRTRAVEVGGKVLHFMKLAESAEEVQEGYERQLAAGAEDCVDAEYRDDPAEDGEDGNPGPDAEPDAGP